MFIYLFIYLDTDRGNLTQCIQCVWDMLYLDHILDHETL